MLLLNITLVISVIVFASMPFVFIWSACADSKEQEKNK